MIPQAMFGLGVPELLIILAVVLLLFGGSRLAGLGKSTGRALKEFKEETKGLKSDGHRERPDRRADHPAAGHPAGSADPDPGSGAQRRPQGPLSPRTGSHTAVALSILGRPVRFNLNWLKPPPTPPDGSMTLFEHLRELRYRLVIAVGAIVIGMIVSALFYSQLFDVLRHPYDVAIAALKEKNPDQVTDLVNIGLASPFILALKVCLVSGLVLTSPVWLYQLWSFIVPGLLAKEKKWAMIFIGTATPLFLAGVVTGYLIMPKGIAVLLGFTQDGVANLQNINDFLSFMLRLMVVFGIAFLIPLIVLDAQHRRRRQGVAAVQGPHLRHLRHLRVRGRGHALHRPLLDARPGRPDGRPVPRGGGSRPRPGPAQGQAGAGG